MYELLHIPMPPIPQGLTGMLIGLGVVVVGLALLMLGWLLWRGLAAVIMAGLGVLAGILVAGQFGLPSFWSMIIGAAAGAVAGLLLASMVWAIWLGGVLSLAAMLGELQVLRTSGKTGGVAGFEFADSFAQWLGKAGATAWEWLRWLFTEHPLATIIAGALPLTLGLVLGIFRPILTRILATSLMGALMGVVGAVTVVVALKSTINIWTGYGPALMLGILLLMWVIGVVYQYRMERIIASRYAKAEEKSAKSNDSQDDE